MSTEINAITFVVSDMEAAVAFYTVAGLPVVFGGPGEPFTSLRLGESNFVNLMIHDAPAPGFWGRVVIHVDDPDALWATFRSAGYESLTEPADASWGERYFHICDPDGHELSFARRL